MKSQNIMIVPTETVEGYAVRLDDEQAIRALMQLKNRGFDSNKVFTLVPQNVEAISTYAIIRESAQKIINNHIPGEITIVLPKNPCFRHFYYDHFDTIGIRIPNYAPFQKLLSQTGPLILTSANPKGGTPKTITGHQPSTVVDFTTKTPKILRQGNLKINLDDYID